MRVGPVGAFTMSMLGSVRIFTVGSRWTGVAMMSLSRSGSVQTSLHRNGRPMRKKNWTAKRDHRKRMERWRARQG